MRFNEAKDCEIHRSHTAAFNTFTRERWVIDERNWEQDTSEDVILEWISSSNISQSSYAGKLLVFPLLSDTSYKFGVKIQFSA